MASRRLIKVQTCPSKRDGVGISEGKADDYRVCIFDQELKDIEKSDDLRTMGVTAAPKEEGNLLAWGGIIKGPAPYYVGGTFKLDVSFTNDYPFKAPTVTFRTRIYHPNITEEGNICMGILKADQWKPSTKVEDVLRGLYQLLTEPNPDDPLIPAIAEQYRSDNAGFKKEAMEQTKKYAS
ncbi:MAG: hypothetical protein CYPHOPRED_005500 [Cyphobasidiales sp. Tagirdzhanova-0007]|nr:MAG: hypothetical protein CYPHOPRED_005500 [Cyphobasidiales sp. Tagirdzhanova-0007]